jgi:hypothetical protein
MLASLLIRKLLDYFVVRSPLMCGTGSVIGTVMHVLFEVLYLTPR